MKLKKLAKQIDGLFKPTNTQEDINSLKEKLDKKIKKQKKKIKEFDNDKQKDTEKKKLKILKEFKKKLNK